MVAEPGLTTALGAVVRCVRRSGAVVALVSVLAIGGCSAPVDGGRTRDADPANATSAPSPGAVGGESAHAAEPLVTATPDQHSEVGRLVPGFPTDLLPVPADAAILVTSAVPVGDADVQEVSLNLRTAMTGPELLEMYRASLTTAGFAEVVPATPEPGLAAEAVFTRSGSDELVSIGVLDVDGTRTVTIGGRIHTGS